MGRINERLRVIIHKGVENPLMKAAFYHMHFEYFDGWIMWMHYLFKRLSEKTQKPEKERTKWQRREPFSLSWAGGGQTRNGSRKGPVEGSMPGVSRPGIPLLTFSFGYWPNQYPNSSTLMWLGKSCLFWKCKIFRLLVRIMRSPPKAMTPKLLDFLAHLPHPAPQLWCHGKRIAEWHVFVLEITL